MAAATLAFGTAQYQGGGGASHQVVGVRGGNLVERSLDSDYSLVSSCLRGDEAAWEELVRLHTRRIYGLCYRFTGSGRRRRT